MADTEARKANALTAMMNDLGLGRMEELAKDNRRDDRRIVFPVKSMHAPPPTTKPRVLQNEAAQGWNSAVTSGAFRDEDALGVDSLDTIAGGRLHAINKANREWGGDGGRRHTGNRSRDGGLPVLNQKSSWKEMKDISSSSEMSRYDPANPSKPKPMLHPRRRHFGLPSGEFCASENRSLEVRGAATSDSRKLFLPHAPTKADTYTVVQPPRNPSTTIPPHLRLSSEVKKSERPAKEVEICTVVQPSSSSTSIIIPPHMRVPSKIKTPKRSAEETNFSAQDCPSSLACSDASNSLAHQLSGSTSVNTSKLPSDANVPLPGANSAAEVVPPKSNTSIALDRPFSSNYTTRIDISGLNIFFEAKITAARINKVTGDINVSPGKTYIFQYPGKDIAIWELRWSDGYVIREDFRVFVSPFNNGSRVIVRRQDRPNEVLRTTQVRVDDVTLGLKFVRTCKELKVRFQSSTDPRYPYTEEKNEPTEGMTIDFSTLLPLSEMIRHLNQQDTLRAEEQLRQKEETARPKVPAHLEIETTKLDIKKQQPEVAVTVLQEDFEAASKGTQDFNEQDKIEGRKVLESKTAMSSRATDTLISTSPEASPRPKAISCVDDLGGMVYERPPLAYNTAKTTPVPYEPSESAKSALVLVDNPDLTGQQVAQADARKEGVFSAAKLAKVPVGVDLSRQSLVILSNLGINHYRELSHSFDDTLYWVKQTDSHGINSIQESIAVQVVLIHLARYTSFKELNYEDQLKTTAVVFFNLRQLKTCSVIKYSLHRIIQLRQSARPAPPAVILANDYLKLAKQATDQRQSGHVTAVERKQAGNDDGLLPIQAVTKSRTENLTNNQPGDPFEAHAELLEEAREISHKPGLEKSRWA